MATTLQKHIKTYIDLDIDFNMHPVTHNVFIKKSIAAVKQSIIRLLTLQEWDKPFHPEIKSPVYDFLFENVGNVQKIILEDQIRKYLNNYEPRIIVNTVTVTYPDPNSISIDIDATIIRLFEDFVVNILINRLR